MSLTLPPTAPDIADPSTFEARAQAFVLWITTNEVPELNTIIGTTIPAGSAAAGTLTGNALAANVINSSLAMRGGIAGLTLSNNATVTKLDVAAGICKDSTNAVSITLSAAITAGLIQTSGAWAAGSTQNKLDTGARANSTWYHVWAIMKDSDNSGDFLFSLSVSAPTMPTGYTYKRRIGSVLTDGSGNITAFTQNGDEFLWTVNVTDVNATPGHTTADTRTLTVPTGTKVNALMHLTMVDGTGQPLAVITSLDQTDFAPSLTGGAQLACAVVGIYGATDINVRTNTSAQVRSRVNSTTAQIVLNTYGWIDTRGRYA